MMRKHLPLIIAASLLAACTSQPPDEEAEAEVQVEQEAVDNTPAPSQVEGAISDAIVPGDPAWAVEQWTRLQVGEPAPTLQNLLGKVVIVFCFQSW